jgi:CRISPR/Cas system-associated exonuclease Cas4 (RecB family)
VALPPEFQFSQGSLQDYVDCPRRFQLRYVLRLAWPAPVAEPMLTYEQHMHDGEAFHRLVHQHILGLSPERLSLCVQPEQEDLYRWWDNYRSTAPARLPGSRYPELGLSAALGDGDHRLGARYDLVIFNPGREAVIFDWKTASARPRRSALALRLQTRVYRYLLVRAGSALNGYLPLVPEQVRMVYWFAEFPDDPETFEYDARQYGVDEAYLADLLRQIAACGDQDLATTADARACAYCVYRSLCERGTRAGEVSQADADLEQAGGPEASGSEAGFSYEQISEIAF